MELVVDLSTNLREAHSVHTVARIGGGPPGLMVATSRFVSRNLLTGFKAQAVVALTDEFGTIIALSDKQHGWADSIWFGVSDNQQTWTYQFDPQIASRATGIAVFHAFDEDWIRNLENALRIGRMALEAILEFIRSLGDGRNGYAESSQTGTSTWPLVGPPWSGYVQASVGTAVVSATPAEAQEGVSTNITVEALDSVTGQPINGTVYIGTAVVGATGRPFRYTWNRKYRRIFDPRTRTSTIEPLPFNKVQVRADNYVSVDVPFNVIPSVIIDID